MKNKLIKKLGIFIAAIIIASALFQLLITFDTIATRIIEKSSLFKVIENILVPYEEILVGTILKLSGVPTIPGTVEIIKNGESLKTFISWNCIGWQSLIVLGISLMAGLSGRYTKKSKIQVLLIGILGAFVFNIARIATILILLFYFDASAAAFIHKYGAVILSLLWLIFFWWFSFNFVLEEKHSAIER